VVLADLEGYNEDIMDTNCRIELLGGAVVYFKSPQDAATFARAFYGMPGVDLKAQAPHQPAADDAPCARPLASEPLGIRRIPEVLEFVADAGVTTNKMIVEQLGLQGGRSLSGFPTKLGLLLKPSGIQTEEALVIQRDRFESAWKAGPRIREAIAFLDFLREGHQ
jgi:hypothetical protein